MYKYFIYFSFKWEWEITNKIKWCFKELNTVFNYVWSVENLTKTCRWNINQFWCQRSKKNKNFSTYFNRTHGLQMFLSNVGVAGVVLGDVCTKGGTQQGSNVWWYRRNDDEQNGKRWFLYNKFCSGEKGNKWKHGNNGNEIIKTNKTMILHTKEFIFLCKEKKNLKVWQNIFLCLRADKHSCS